MMGIKIESLRSIADCREQLNFCYLCGSQIRPSQKYSAEHVIPRALLRLEQNIPDSERYPVILEVHSKCDTQLKARNDNIMAAFSALHHHPSSDWSENRIKQVVKIFKKTFVDEFGNRLPAVDADAMLDACRCWIQGLHALLYRSFLPSRPDMHHVFAPTPNFHSGDSQSVVVQSRDSLREQMAVWNEYQSLVDNVIDSARECDALDTVTAWGSKLKYECVWAAFVGKKKSNHFKATCFWNLRHPGIQSLIADVPGSVGNWSGSYEYFAVPKGASVVTEFMNP